MVQCMRLGIVLITLVLAAGSAAAVPAASHAQQAPAVERAVIGKQVIGHSVRGRPIRAWHLGQPGKPKVLLVSTMHGNEGAPRRILTSLRNGRPIRGIDLWVLPTYNPDGLAAGTRKNAHGVDLNRNFPYRWADLDGSYESGPRPRSEPETRAMMGFLRDIRPGRIVSFHQPLHGVDTDTKNQRFARRVANSLNLPRKAFTCGGVCHGTMTGWFNHHFGGAALTVEYGAHPSRRKMRVAAPKQVLSIWGARRVAR
jgi:murein peptide amidase A